MPRSLLDRFENMITPEPNTGCWLWLGSTTYGGYGHMRNGASIELSHRVAWCLYRTPIPPGLLALHRCDNTLCCNPDHIFLGTHRDNMRDMAAKGRGNRGKTHCIYGHEFTEENTYVLGPHRNNERVCRACAKRRTAKSKEQK